MNAIDLLLKRASAVKLGEPAPSRDDIDTMLKCAVTAPDHGRIRPWRFVVIRGASRERFGELLALSLKQAEPQTPEEQLSRERAKAMRAPVIIMVAASVDLAHKVPAVEQVLAAGAAAENLILAANALGYGAVWKTGAPAYSDLVKERLGLKPTDSIVGFVYVGTEVAGASPLPRAEPGAAVAYWD